MVPCKGVFRFQSCICELRTTLTLSVKFTHRKVPGSNPTFACRLPLSRLGQPGSIPALVLPSGGTAVVHQKSAIAKRFFASQKCIHYLVSLMGYLRTPKKTTRYDYLNRIPWRPKTWCLPVKESHIGVELEVAQWLKRKFIDRKVCGSNSTSASRVLLSGVGQPDSISAIMLPSVA
ncbi:hypothetical protein CSKR_111356 [Clonorchis sinensis]|uniref:Uncharacterized protein n=1 Tax=Clonorchis sinensis TaxID=79923 RepID=A0A3R7GBQ4_CLOSI|nr:hypothetical protein CSKR_111356 [Clonorchis sinensis]